ncbi:MAG: serine hydrolase domain-containing protein [Phycisphaerales bacterium JB040]
MLRRLVVSVLGVMVGVAVAQTEGQPGGVDRSGEIEAMRGELRVPALAGAAVDEDGVLGWGVSGVRSSRSRVEVRRDDRFHVGSLTKAMTATMIGVLVERGELGWDTTIGEGSPQLAAKIPLIYHGVTIEQLLGHRAGLPDDRAMEDLVMRMWNRRGDPFTVRMEGAADAFNHATAEEPGARRSYSNAGYIAAGHLAEVATGKSWEELMRELVFEPLGMTTAGFGAPGTPGKLDQPWGHKADGGGWDPVRPGVTADNPEALGPAGRAHCSIEDLAKFARAHLAGLRGEDGIVTAETFKKLHADPEADGYGLGWGITPTEFGTRSAHTGSNTRWLAMIALWPDRNLGVVLAMNARPEIEDNAGVMERAIGVLVGEGEGEE